MNFRHTLPILVSRKINTLAKEEKKNKFAKANKERDSFEKLKCKVSLNFQSGISIFIYRCIVRSILRLDKYEARRDTSQLAEERVRDREKCRITGNKNSA